MIDKLCWFTLYGFRGFIYASPIFLLSMVLTFIHNRLFPVVDTGFFTAILTHLSNGFMLLELGTFFGAFLVWVVTWLSDYREGYLPNWIRKELY